MKSSITPPDGNQQRSDRCALAAHALDRIEPDLLSESLLRVIRSKEEGVGHTASELLRFAGALGDIDLAWSALPVSSRHRVKAAITTANLHTLLSSGIFTRRLPEDIAATVESQRSKLGVADLLTTAQQYPDLSYIQAAIHTLADAKSFRAAEAAMEQLILPVAAEMSVREIKSLLSEFQKNDQIRFASGMPALMDDFFELTLDYFPECTTEWYNLRVALEVQAAPESYYTYPDLRNKIYTTPPF